MDSPTRTAMDRNIAEKTADSMVKKYSEEEVQQKLNDLGLNIVSSPRANFNTLRQFVIDIILNHQEPDIELRRIKARVLSDRARAQSQVEKESIQTSSRSLSPPVAETDSPYEDQLPVDDNHSDNGDVLESGNTVSEDTGPTAPPLSDVPLQPPRSNVSSDLMEMLMFMERQRRDDLQRQREEMLEMFKTVSSQQTTRVPSIRLSPTPSRHESDHFSDPQVIDRRYEQYVNNAFEAVNTLGAAILNSSSESDLDYADEKAQINVQKLLSFVEQYIVPEEFSLKKESRLQQSQLVEKNFDQAHLSARSRIRIIQKEDEQRKRQSFLPPYIKVPTFQGDVLNFASWIAEFDQLVHLNPDVHKQGKLKAMKEALKGAAATTLINFDIIGENYENAYTLVRKRFGRPRLLIHHEVESILKISELKDDATSYRKCLETIQTRSMNLESQKADRETVLVGLVVPKFTKTLRMSWERHLKSHIEDDACASMKDLVDFLQVETELLEAQSTSTKQVNYVQKKPQNGVKHQGSAQGSAHSLPATSGPLPNKNIGNSNGNQSTCSKCSCCGEPHGLEVCKLFFDLDDKDRLLHVFTAKVCRSCLCPYTGPKHTCKRTCPICSQRHHELIHDAYAAIQNTTLQKQSSENSSPHNDATPTSINGGNSLPMVISATTSHSKHSQSFVALPILQAKIVHRGRSAIVNIGFDSFSEKSFITKDIVDKLNLPTSRIAPLIVSGFGGWRTELKEATSIDLIPVHPDSVSSQSLHVHAIIRDGDICDPISAVHLRTDAANVLENYTLTRAPLTGDVRVHVLLGAQHVISNLRMVTQLGKDGPCLMSTPFGYTIAGAYRSTVHLKTTGTVTSCLLLSPTKPQLILDGYDGIGEELPFTSNETEVSKLNTLLEHHMSLESWGLETTSSLLTSEEALAEQKFQENVIYDHVSKQYEVALPFRDNSPPLSDSYNVVLKMMLRTEKQLLKNPEKLKRYNEAMSDYIKFGFARELSEIELKRALSEEHVFLPHHPVLKDSISTALRVVFNASNKSGANKLSLNDVLLPGPKLQPDLCQILLRFRSNRIAVSGDVSKMFLMTRLSPSHWKYQLYLWRDGDVAVSPRVYSMVTLMFGVTSSPFLAIRSMRHHLDQYEKEYPDLVEEIRKNMYVDDFLFGGDDEAKVQKQCHDSIGILAEGGWELRKFSSNSCSILESLSPDQRMPNSLVSFDDDLKLEAGISTTLGVIWDTKEDTLELKVSEALLTPVKKVTKRTIVSRFSSIYDVFGFVCPFTLKMKIVVQNLWKQKYDWDDRVSEQVEREYRSWERELADLQKIRLPRWNQLSPKVVETQLCGFSDASSSALGCVVYLRVVDSVGGITITYFMAKSKVAPVKAVTVARLELVAAELLSKVIRFVRESLDSIEPEIHLWTDSSIVLAWISRPSYDWKIYVRNRVQKIQDLTSDATWYHIPGVENPADVHSRGSSLNDLLQNTLYWFGPSWLQQPVSCWPYSTPPEPTNEEIIVEEVKSTVCTSIPASISYSFILDRTNDYQRCLHYAGYIRRWFNKTKNRTNSNNSKPKTKEPVPLTTLELKNAEDGLLRVIQWNHFPAEYKALREGKPVPRESRIIKYKPIWNMERRLIVANGRLTFSHLHPEMKNPVILPSKDRLVELLILYHHRRRAHTPQDHTVNLLRQKYAILQCRQAVRRVLSSCLECKHYNAPQVQQEMGDLPESRVASITAPFSTLGLDYTGALKVKAPGGKKIKAYILIATCAQTRMCHLELTTGMRTEDTLGALRRIVNRRGLPQKIISDNAKYFIKCSQIVKPAIQCYTSSEGIDWEFIVERAPHRGAFWERLIRSTKEPLRKVIGNAMLSWEQTITLLSDVERHLNSRPLTYTGADPNNPLSLTPAHLCLGRSLEQVKESSSQIKSLDVSYHQQRTVLQSFWKRWEREYIPTLMTRQKWLVEKEPLHENDVVLITEENTRRPQWKLGRIIEGIRSRDGIIRTYRLQPAKGELNRPVQRLRLWEEADSVQNNPNTVSDEPELVSPSKISPYEQLDTTSIISSSQTLQNDLDPQADLRGECNRVVVDKTKTTDQTPVVQTSRYGRQINKPTRFQ